MATTPEGHTPAVVTWWNIAAILALVALSVVLLFLLGTIGEEILNAWHRNVDGFSVLPVLSEWVRNSFPLNSRYFVRSLTPSSLLLVLTAIIALLRPGQNLLVTFLYFFIGVWLITLCYLGVFVVAILAPFHVLLVVVPGTQPAFDIAIQIFDGLLMTAIVVCIGWIVARRRRSRFCDRSRVGVG